MEISGIFTALVIGLIIGALGRLVLPGRQQIGFWLTLLIGVVAALLGTFVAAIFGVAKTAGIDWIELGLQVAFAAGGVAIADGVRGGRDRRAIDR
ncbi:GlsB/YeaQ/YmgE family stress response membrane protein [Dactylosporangium sucinum]|uniref:Membrane protein n=1 Tax=Dactylosporangium sucinum TaxID=1424081 RepID=A0A917X7F6_9ACTN|nr:GlsB/YeaQ/YmgE family stress response membrane protein [Dactylosporangium sucinum]GGM82904.1 membrane protein [Dactylosporangium sucinum]